MRQRKNNGRSIKTTINQIANYWIENNNIDEGDLNFDWADCHKICWNCGDEKNKIRIQRCHIIPHSLGGKDVPSNFVLLCARCHDAAPNTANKNDIWDWIKTNAKFRKENFYFLFKTCYNTYDLGNALHTFKQKEGYCFIEKVVFVLGNKKDGMEYLKKTLKNEAKKISTHWGIGINNSTYYYLLKSVMKKIREEVHPSLFQT